MSARTATIILGMALLVLTGNGLKADPSKCPTHPLLSSAKDLVFFVDDCAIDILSPDKMFRLHVSYLPAGRVLMDPAMKVYQRGRRKPVAVSYKGHLDPPIGVMWSPTNQAISMLDERGSGQDGVLRVFVRDGDTFVDDPLFQQAAVQEYWSRNKCRRVFGPTVGPFGWSSDGKILYAEAVPWVHDSCGHTIDLEMDLASHTITHVKVLPRRK